jgi:alkaline phosphatase D
VTSDNVDDILKVPPRSLSPVAEGVLRANNRHVREVELDSHGYGVLDVRQARVRMDWYALSDRTRADTGSSPLMSFGTASGTQRVVRA